MAAALYAVLIRAAKENTLDVELFRRLAAAGTLSPVPGLYPTAFRTCGGAVYGQAGGGDQRPLPVHR